jgi:chromosome segregation protein
LPKQFYGLAVEKNEKDKQAKLLVERQNEVKSKLAQLEGRKSAVESRVESLREDADGQDETIRDLNKRLGDIEKNIASFEDNIALAGNRISENDKHSARLEDDISGIDGNGPRWKSNFRQYTVGIPSSTISSVTRGFVARARGSRGSLDTPRGRSSYIYGDRKNKTPDSAKTDILRRSRPRRFADMRFCSFTELECLFLARSCA